MCLGGCTTCGHDGPIVPLWWLVVLCKGLVLAIVGVVRSAPQVLDIPRKGLVLTAVDVVVSIRRCDAQHPLLGARRLLKALVFRLLLSSPISSSMLVVCCLRWWSDLAPLLAVLCKDWCSA